MAIFKFIISIKIFAIFYCFSFAFNYQQFAGFLINFPAPSAAFKAANKYALYVCLCVCVLATLLALA